MDSPAMANQRPLSQSLHDVQESVQPLKVITIMFDMSFKPCNPDAVVMMVVLGSIKDTIAGLRQARDNNWA